MAFKTKRNNPARPLAFANSDFGFGFTKMEEAALGIYTQLIATGPAPITGYILCDYARTAIEAADIFFDVLEQPEKEKADAIAAAYKEKALALEDMKYKFRDGVITQEELYQWYWDNYEDDGDGNWHFNDLQDYRKWGYRKGLLD